MKRWSDNPIHEKFCIKFFFDTNILVYLIDGTDSELNKFVDELLTNPFSRMVSSQFVIFEFIGVRKREHYLRIAAENAKNKSISNQINYNSLYYNLDTFKNPNVKFEQSIQKIKTLVSEELNKIINDYGINYEYGIFHYNHLKLTEGICLSSKINNNDSMVLATAILPKPNQCDYLNILSNDAGFEKASKSDQLGKYLKSIDLNLPNFLSLQSVRKIIEKINKESNTKKDKTEIMNEFFLDKIRSNPELNFLGKTFLPKNNGFPLDCISFHLLKEQKIKNNLFITIIGKDLDFIYSPRRKVEFWHNGKAIPDFFTAQERDSNLSFRLKDIDEDGKEIDLEQEILNEIRDENNLIFIHPDSDI